jgi:excisionase family DNA binding protein
MADLAELQRVGEEWRDGNRSGCVTEMRRDSSQLEISTQEAASMLDRTDSRVRQLLRDGILPGRCVGRRWLVRRCDVVAFRDGVVSVAT